MLFKINVNYNISKKPIKQATRHAYISHERRLHSNYSNKSINPLLSKYNSYNTFFSYSRAIRKDLMPYIKHHNCLKSVKNDKRRKIKSVHSFLLDRGTKIPYKFIVLKMGTMQNRAQLIKLFRDRGFTEKDYFNAVNKSFYDYGLNHNKHSKWIHYDHLDVNNDELSSHAHIGALSTAKTASGKVSMSFDRGTKCEYKGRDNRVSWQIMQHREAVNFLKFATYEFQKYLGPNFKFQLTRNPKNKYNNLEHNEYIKIQQMNDRLRQVLCSTSALNRRLCGDLKRLVNWKHKATMTMLEAIIWLKSQHQRLLSQKDIKVKLKKLQANNNIFMKRLRTQPTPDIMAIAQWLNTLPKPLQLKLLKLSKLPSNMLISSLASYVAKSKIRNL